MFFMPRNGDSLHGFFEKTEDSIDDDDVSTDDDEDKSEAGKGIVRIGTVVDDDDDSTDEDEDEE